MKAEMIMMTEVSYPDQERAWLFFLPDDGTVYDSAA